MRTGPDALPLLAIALALLGQAALGCASSQSVSESASTSVKSLSTSLQTISRSISRSSEGGDDGTSSAAYRRDVRAIAVITRRVVIADWLFTTPTAVIQPLTGFWLLHLSGMPWTAGWVLWSLVLYVIAGACWLPAVWIQIRMAAIAERAAAASEPLPPRFRRYHLVWTGLGWPAFIAFVAIFFLMVVKP